MGNGTVIETITHVMRLAESSPKATDYDPSKLSAAR